MPRLIASGQSRAITVVVFDKDGTLIDFDKAWTGRLRRAVRAAVDLAGSALPAGDRALETALTRTLGVRPQEMAMIGDSAGDMSAARAAGAGFTIGVTSGPATAAELAPLADVVVADIHAVGVTT